MATLLAVIATAARRATARPQDDPAATAAAVAAPVALRTDVSPEPITGFLVGVATRAGSDPAEMAGRLSVAWDYGDWVRRLSAALGTGRLLDVRMLVAAMPGPIRDALSAGELAAVSAEVDGRALRLVDAVAEELGYGAEIEAVTAAEVEAALAADPSELYPEPEGA